MAPVSCQFKLFPQGNPSRELTWDRQNKDAVLEVLPFQILHDDEGLALMLTNIVMTQMWGWFSDDAALASLWNRSRACLFSAYFSGRNFRATLRPRRVSSAL